MSVQGPSVYTDFAGLAALRSRSGAEDPEVLRQVAQQFETLFTGMMLKSMRDASFGDPLFGSNDEQTYREMFDQQVALELSRGKGLGIAEMLVRQLSGTVVSHADGQPNPVARFSPGHLPAVTSRDVRTGAADAPAERFRPGDPTEFIRGVWPHARDAAAELGVDPRAVVAQAALETGWGQHMIRAADGSDGNNLFGIKADPDWTGGRVAVSTLEFDDGLPRRQVAAFRTYETLEAGFRDYVRFLKSHGRYREALAAGADAGAFADGLQRAGYATDPRYAEKIRGIVDSGRLESVLGPLKISDGRPIDQRGTGGAPVERTAATRIGV